MKISVVAPKKISGTTEKLLSAAKEVFGSNNYELISINDLVVESSDKGINLIYDEKRLETDYALTRIDGKRLEHGYKIVSALDKLGIPHPYNAETLRIAHDKFLTCLVLSNEKINVPKTFSVRSISSLKKISKSLTYPAIVKLLSGSGGKGVIFVEDAEQLVNVCESIKESNQEIVVQEFIPNPGCDIRILVVNSKVIAGMKRIAKKGDVRANVSRGGKAVNFDPSDDIKEIALKSAEILNAEILAVDIIVGNDEVPRVIEVNVNPGIRGLEKATDKNVAKAIMLEIKEMIKK